MDLFVTDTMIIDVRSGDFIQAGNPFPEEAMHPFTFKSLSVKGEVLPFTQENKYRLNSRLAQRRDVLSSIGVVEAERNDPKGLRDLVAILDETTDDIAEQEKGPRKLMVPVGESLPASPPEVSVVEKPHPANVWTYNPIELKGYPDEVLQVTLVERCRQFDINPVPVITSRKHLIKFMSKDFVAITVPEAPVIELLV